MSRQNPRSTAVAESSPSYHGATDRRTRLAYAVALYAHPAGGGREPRVPMRRNGHSARPLMAASAAARCCLSSREPFGDAFGWLTPSQPSYGGWRSSTIRSSPPERTDRTTIHPGALVEGSNEKTHAASSEHSALSAESEPSCST